MNHPITEQIRRQIEEIEEAKERQNGIYAYSRMWSNNFELAFNGIKRLPLVHENSEAIYVLDKDLNILHRLEAKYLVRQWIEKVFGKVVSDKTTYRYFTSGKLYKGKYYFVPVDKYESFVKKFQLFD
ncbi:hypothetical protein [Bacillus cihuensis]|uniref:hypothetical protein n=1 Tax=Bacillus cihuensis TaxID=1208599 RepID=UPI0004071313|nr:hypothetical protein [Bacillus cihuensis]